MTCRLDWQMRTKLILQLPDAVVRINHAARVKVELGRARHGYLDDQPLVEALSVFVSNLGPANALVGLTLGQGTDSGDEIPPVSRKVSQDQKRTHLLSWQHLKQTITLEQYHNTSSTDWHSTPVLL